MVFIWAPVPAVLAAQDGVGPPPELGEPGGAVFGVEPDPAERGGSTRPCVEEVCDELGEVVELGGEVPVVGEVGPGRGRRRSRGQATAASRAGPVRAGCCRSCFRLGLVLGLGCPDYQPFPRWLRGVRHP